MANTNALAILAGINPKDRDHASAPTNLHVLSGEVYSKSEEGRARILLDGLVFSAEDAQWIEVDSLGGLEEGDTATILLAGEEGKGMTPLALGTVGGIDRIVVRVDAIEADYVKATVLDAQIARIDELEADEADISTLVAQKADITDLTAAEARIDAVEADTAKIHNLTANQISAATGYIADLTAGNVTAQNIIADKAKLAQLDVNEISADHATIESLDTTYATITNLNSAEARIDTIESDYLKAADMTAEVARVGTLLADKADVDDLEVAEARIDSLEADHVTVADFQAEQGYIDQLQANTADIATIRANAAKVQNLTAAQLEADHATIGTLDTTYMHADMSNSDVAWISNGVIANGAISSAMINDVSANKLTAGTINGSVINVTNLNADNITAGTINGQRIGEGSLSLSKLEDDVYTEAEVDAKLSTMQAEIDGAIETWTGTAVPTLQNAPASGWTTTADRDRHVGDVYFVVNAQSQQNGYNYRFTKSGNTYSWQLIKDTDITNALQRLTTAEGKITTFDSDISTLKTDTGTLTTKTQSLETSLGDKADITTVNEISDTVDGHTQSITQLSTTTTTALQRGVEYINGTQTAATGSWTGVTTDSALYTGKTIAYRLPYAGSGNASLQLKDSNGNNVGGNIAVYMNNTRVNTHYPANTVIKMTYDGTYWRTDNYDSNTYDREKYSASVTAAAAISAGRIGVFGTDGNLKLLAASAFDLTRPILYIGTAYTDSALTQTNNYVYYGAPFALTNTHAITGAAAGKAVYIVGTISNNVMTPTSTVLTCTEPSTADGYFYLRLGTMATAANAILESNHPLYAYIDGKFQQATPQVVTTVNKVSEHSQTIDGIQTKIGSLETQVETKADGSTVTTIRNELNDTNDTVSGHTSQLTSVTAKMNTVANPNLSPFWDRADGDLTYWSSVQQGYYSSELGKIGTQLEDGWAHFVMDNSARTGNAYVNFHQLVDSNLKRSTAHTFLIELRNLAFASGSTIRVQPITNNQTSARYDQFVTQNPMYVDVTEDGSYYVAATTHADYSSCNCMTDGFFYVAAGVSCEFDIRISLYEGEYSGPYKPYVDQALRTNLTSLQTDYATFKQTTTEFESTIGTTIDEKIADISIGGRNFFRHSDTLDDSVWWGRSNISSLQTMQSDPDNGTGAIAVTPSTTNWWLQTVVKSVLLKDVGETYTASVWLKADAACTVKLNIRYMQSEWADSTSATATTRKPVSVTTSWQRFSVTGTLTYAQTADCFWIGQGNSTNKVYIYHPQLERGNVTTEWSPNPEDMATARRVAAAETSITQNANQIALRATKTEVFDTGNMLKDTSASDLTKVYGPSNRYWSDAAQASITPSFVAISDSPEPGITHAAQFVCDGSSTSATQRGLAFYSGESTTNIPMKEGQTYAASWWARKTSGSGRTRLAYRSGGVFVTATRAGKTGYDDELTTEWKQYTRTFTMGEVTDYNRVWFYAYFPASTAGMVQLCGFKIVPAAYATAAELKVQADSIDLKVSKNDVINQINVSTEGATISASKVNIEGAAIFSSGRLSQTSLNNAYDAKGAASTAETNAKAYTDSQPSYVVFPTTYSYTLGSWLVYAEEGYQGSWSQVKPVKVGDTVLIKGTASDTSDAVYVLVTVDAVNSSGSITKATSHGLIDPTAGQRVQTNLDNLEIGGRNFLRGTASPVIGSRTPPRWMVQSGGDGVGSIATISDSPVQDLTKTFRITGNTSGNKDFVQDVTIVQNDFGAIFRFSAYARGIGGSVTALIRSWNNTKANEAFRKTVTVGTEWTRLDFEFIATSNGATDGDWIDARFGLTGSGSIEYIAPKLEYGNKATDWTPAPEDVAADISAAQTTANNAAPKANAVKRTQRIYWRTSAAKNSWTMPTAWLTVTGDVFDQWTCKVPRLTANADGTGTKYLYLYTCEQREMANGTLEYTSVLLDDSTTVIDGGTIITGSVTANKLNASDINASNSLTIGALSTSTQDDILNSNVVVGGRNILRGTAGMVTGTGVWDMGTFRASGTGATLSNVTSSGLPLPSVSGALRVTNNGSSASNVGLAQDTIAGFIVGEEYTESGWIRASTTMEAYFQPIWISNSQYAPGNGDKRFQLTTEWQWFSWTSTLTGTQSSYYSGGYVYAYQCPVGGWIEVCGLKLEKGNRATDWSPAPEDLDADISAAQSTADGAQSSATTANNKIAYYNRRCQVGQSTTLNADKPWYKVASCTITAQYLDRELVLDVFNAGGYAGGGPGSQEAGRLYVHFRASGSISSAEVPVLIWQWRNGEIVPANFVLAYKVTSGTKIDAELWCKCDRAYAGYQFVVVHDASRTELSETAYWTLYNTWTNGSQAAITSGYTQVVSVDASTGFITRIDDAGITIHPSGTTSNRAAINANGMQVYKGNVDVASYGDTARIGKANSSRFLMNADSLQAYNSSNAKYFEVSASGMTFGTNTVATTQNVTDAVNDISVGGRNLLLWSSPSAENLAKISSPTTYNSFVTEDGYSCYKIIDASTNGAQYASSSGKQPVILSADTTYTYSAWVKVTTTGSDTSVPLNFTSLGHFAVINNASTATDKTHEDVAAKRIYSPSTVTIGEWTRIALTFTTNSLDKSTFGLYPKYALGTAYTVYIRNQKLELGNKATDWTLAPEDVDASITDAESNAKSYADDNFLPEGDNRIWYATCDTAAATVAKVATITPTTTKFTLAIGQTVNVKFSVANSADRNSITLSVNGTTAKPIRYTASGGGVAVLPGNGYLAAGRTYQFVYDGSYWVCQMNYDSNTYDRTRLNNAFKAAENLPQYVICGGSSSGFKKVVSGLAIDLTYPIAYLGTGNVSGQTYAVASGGTTTAFYSRCAGVNLQYTKASWTGTQYSSVYLKGTVDGKTFTVHSDIFTTTVPTSDDGYAYIPIGMLYSTYQVYFDCDNTVYAFRNGAFQKLDTVAKYITAITDAGIRVHAKENPTTNYAAIDADGMDVVKGGVSVAQFGETARVGKTTGSYVEIDYHSLKLKDREGGTYFHVSDLRDANGVAEMTDKFRGDGETKTFSLALPSVNTTFSVTVSDDSGGTCTKSAAAITFSTPPTWGSTITAVYTTASNNAKAYTFGARSSGTIGAVSLAEGLANTASGGFSHAEGNGSTASGKASHAEGSSTASGTKSHAEGLSALASGNYSHAEGTSTASGEESHSEGIASEASGFASHAEGNSTTASGDWSHAQGMSTTAAGESQTAIGRYNRNYPGTTALEIGNGIWSEEDEIFRLSNAMSVEWGGKLNLIDQDMPTSAPSSSYWATSNGLYLYGAVKEEGVQPTGDETDADDAIGYVRPMWRSDNGRGVQIEAQRTVNDVRTANGLGLTVNDSGDPFVTLSRAAWLRALGISYGYKDNGTTVNSGAYIDVTVNYGITYSSTPTVVVGLCSTSTAGTFGRVSVAVASRTTTGFTARLFNGDSTGRVPDFSWVAFGVPVNH